MKNIDQLLVLTFDQLFIAVINNDKTKMLLKSYYAMSSYISLKVSLFAAN